MSPRIKSAISCPIDAAISVIEGRWKATILERLSKGALRTGELRRSIPEISERMLIRHLHELVHSGIVLRHDEGTLPPCVRYSVSDYGRTLLPLLVSLRDWGQLHLQRIRAAEQRGAKRLSKKGSV